MKLTRYLSTRLCFFGCGGVLALPEAGPDTAAGGTLVGRGEVLGVGIVCCADPDFDVVACGSDEPASDFFSA